MSDIGFSTLNTSGACSSLLMWDLEPPDVDEWDDLEEFKDAIKKNCSLVSRSAINSKAFIVVSTNEGSTVQKFLKDLGFTSTEEQYNTQNETTVQLWTCPAPKFAEAVWG